MKKVYYFFAEWRKRDVQFLNSLDLSKTIEEGSCSFSVEEGDSYHKIMEHFTKENGLFSKTKPNDFYTTVANVSFSNEELESAQSYTTTLGRGKLEPFWDDSAQWKAELFGGQCDQCGQPIGKQESPWVLKKDFKNLEKSPLVGFEGLGGFLFCGKELANKIQKEFGIGQIEVLIGKNRRVSEHLVQLDIPLATQKLKVNGNEFGQPFEDNKYVDCPVCFQQTYTNQTLDFFPPFEKDFKFDIVLTQEWFGWFRRIVVSRRFMDFCFEYRLLKKWGTSGAIIPQI